MAPNKCFLTGTLHRKASSYELSTRLDDWAVLQPLLQTITIDGRPVTLCKPTESIKCLGVLVNLAQTWDDQVKQLIHTVKTQGQQLARCKVAYAIKRQMEQTREA